MTPASPSTPTSESPPADLVDDEGDRISITGVNGTVARFEMSYSPPSAGDRVKFGPPLRSRIPSAVYLAASIIFAAVTAYAYNAPRSSTLFVWAVEGDRIRPLSASVIAVVLVVSAAATVLRTHMRGVLVSDDWVEARYLLAFGIPRARKWSWAQVTRIIVDDAHVAMEMYDGSFERLPAVADGAALAQLMVHHAMGHRIQVTVLDGLDRAPAAGAGGATRR